MMAEPGSGAASAFGHVMTFGSESALRSVEIHETPIELLTPTDSEIKFDARFKSVKQNTPIRLY
jgi:hypothetical protein